MFPNYISFLLLLTECPLLTFSVYVHLYHPGASQASCIQVFLIAYRGLIGGITIASSLLRGLLALITEVPHLLFPNKVAVGSNVVSKMLVLLYSGVLDLRAPMSTLVEPLLPP